MLIYNLTSTIDKLINSKDKTSVHLIWAEISSQWYITEYASSNWKNVHDEFELKFELIQFLLEEQN